MASAPLRPSHDLSSNPPPWRHQVTRTSLRTCASTGNFPCFGATAPRTALPLPKLGSTCVRGFLLHCFPVQSTRMHGHESHGPGALHHYRCKGVLGRSMPTLWSPLPRPILTSPKNADLQMHHGRCIWGYAVSQPLWAMHGALRKTTGNHRCDSNTFTVATDAYRNPPSNCRYFIPLHFLFSTSVNYVENVAAVPGLLFQHGKVEGA